MNYNPGQNIWKKLEKSSKLDRKRKVWYHFCVLFVCYCQSLISEKEIGHWARIQKNREKHPLRSATFSKLAG